MFVGKYVNTPRFCSVRIEKIYENKEDAFKDGYKEPTYYDSIEWEIRGKCIGINRMIFCAIKK